MDSFTYKLLIAVIAMTGVYTRRSSALLKSDLKPAVFWTSTPANYWYSNVGTNSMGQGFWFELSGTPGAQPITVCEIATDKKGTRWKVIIYFFC